MSSPLERLRRPCHSLITHCSIRILSTRLGTKWEPHKSSSAWMLWIKFEGWHTFSAPHRPTDFWLRGKGSVYSSWVGYHLLPFHWLQSPACRQGGHLQPKFSSLLSCLGGLRPHWPSAVPPIPAGGPPYKDLGQDPRKKASTIWENGLQGARDWASEGKGNDKEIQTTWKTGRLPWKTWKRKRKEDALRSEGYANQVQGKVLRPKIFQLDLATEFLLCEWSAQNVEEIQGEWDSQLPACLSSFFLLFLPHTTPPPLGASRTPI